ncbi:MAG: hypothetical protein COV75_08345 [Candidatus Omnitrophica bacterium CG11_big_fil_rev_8_21_14_0_20_63_9]|nr:MAG: hypothetical protein COV75_08345 [Candidatus Omnitrophica bacterium CG11_big_fil_rev_8_21_14_0_20_63_9]
MDVGLDRALLLLEQSRYELAEQELRRVLTLEPNHAAAHALLALCLSHRKQYQQATEEAQRAIHQAPDASFGHYALGTVLHDRGELTDACRATIEAIRLDPYRPEYFARLAAIEFDRARWREALDAAEQGLTVDPEHVGCTNLRAMALVKLGRRGEAGATIDVALARDPENALSHANQGWTLLEAGEAEPALEHFREALRIDPELEWARQGIVEALKARHPIYALMLRYFLWMGRLSPRARWGVVFGAVILSRVLREAGRAVPALTPVIAPLLIAYAAFVILTWIADPLFNLLLRFDRFGRLALSEDQIHATNWIGACLGVCLAALLAGWITGVSAWLIAALVCGLYVMPLSGVFHAPVGRPRRIMAGYAIGLAVLGAAGIADLFARLPSREASPLGAACLGLFMLGVFLAAFLLHALVTARTQR